MRESDSYEGYARDIAQSIYEKIENTKPLNVRHGSTSKWVGLSGYEHQIDVIVEGEKDLLLVECKCWKKTIPTDQILTFIARTIDIRPTFSGDVHSVMLTKIGYDPGAKKLASYYGIDLQYAPDEESFSFFFKNNLIVKPRPASASCNTSCNVVITDQRWE